MMKKILLSALILFLIFSLAACGGDKSSSSITESASAEETTEPNEATDTEKTDDPDEEATENTVTPEVSEESETRVDTDPVGNYELYAFTYFGYTIEASLMPAEALTGLTSISLNEDGRGTFTLSSNEESSTEPSSFTWEIENGELTISDGTSDLIFYYKNGFLTLNSGGSTEMIFAREGADTSSIECIKTSEELDEICIEIGERKHASQQEILKKYGLQNDDNHFVCEQNDMIICYNLEDGQATGMTGYIDCYTEEDAKACYESYEAYAQYYEDVTLDGSVVIIKRSSTGTLETLEELYGDSKIDPE